MPAVSIPSTRPNFETKAVSAEPRVRWGRGELLWPIAVQAKFGAERVELGGFVGLDAEIGVSFGIEEGQDEALGAVRVDDVAAAGFFAGAFLDG